MISYMIIDDEPVAHQIIEDYSKHMSHMQLKKNCFDALEAIDYLQLNQVDLIFLDLNMPKLKGFDFIRTLSSPPAIIVTTAYQEFALEGYELHVVDYLLKPFSFERFLKAVNKLAKPIQSDIPMANSKADERIFLYTDKQHIQVKLNRILWIEGAGNYAKVVLENEVLMVREKLSDILGKLGNDAFLQVHKSFIVGKDHIQRVEGNQIFINNYVIPIGKYFKAGLLSLLN